MAGLSIRAAGLISVQQVQRLEMMKDDTGRNGGTISDTNQRPATPTSILPFQGEEDQRQETSERKTTGKDESAFALIATKNAVSAACSSPPCKGGDGGGSLTR